MSLDPNLFSSTAWYYSRYRPGYPKAFIKQICSKFSSNGDHRALDLGCGTGQLAIPLADSFKEVIGIDPEPQMVSEAKRLAKEKGEHNISFFKGSSENLNTLSKKIGLINLVTIGRAFHWMNRQQVLEDLYPMIVPMGGIAIIGDGSLWTNANNWQTAVKTIVQKYLGKNRRAGNSTFSQVTKKTDISNEEIIKKSKFTDLETIYYSYQLEWDLPHLIGYLYTTSFCSVRLLGKNRNQFEKDLTAALLNLDSKGIFTEDVKLYAHLAWKF